MGYSDFNCNNNKYTNLTSLVNDNFRVINGILLHDAVIGKPKHVVLLKKRVLTKIFTVFIKFWRFNSYFDETFTVTSRSKTIGALRLCVLDGIATAQQLRIQKPHLCFFFMALMIFLCGNISLGA
jgi:hypothetical protein